METMEPFAPSATPPTPTGLEIDTLYAQLRAIARGYLRRERGGHTLQATALVHEAWIQLLRQRALDWSDPGHVQAIAANMMRRILVDSARRHGAVKRGGKATRVDAEDLVSERDRRVQRDHDDHGRAEASLGGVDLLALEEALDRLAEIDPVQVQIVEMRFFGGFSLEQTAAHLGMARRSVDRGWSAARAWLYIAIEGEGSPWSTTEFAARCG